jgi:ABC-2 type transport system permease protein
MIEQEEKLQVKKGVTTKRRRGAEVRGMYAIWLREVKRYLRDRSRLISAFASPVVWLVLFGIGFTSFFTQAGGLNYESFLFAGIVAQTLLFTSVFLGISVIYDRQFGFFKEMLVAPVKRISVFSGKMFGGATDALIQGSIVLILSFPFGFGIPAATLLACLPIMLLTAMGFVSLSLILASRMRTLESFGLIQNLVNLPLFFSSGALFPITNTPQWETIILYFLTGGFYPINYTPYWLQVLNTLNPLTYAVDALRGLTLGNKPVSFSLSTLQYNIIHSLLFGANIYPLWLDLTILGGFVVAVILIGATLFARR